MEETCNRKEKVQKESPGTPERCRASLPQPVAELGIV